MEAAKTPLGPMLQSWRRRRRLSQLDLASETGISQRHLSFVESGRASPSRAMLLRLAEQLSVPPRERNALFLAAGYAPILPERSLEDPGLEAARTALNLILAGHAPHPALAVDRHWNLVAANAAVSALTSGADASLLIPPVNVLRLSLHPLGLGRRIVNFREWRAHVVARLVRDVELSGDAGLAALLGEIEAYPVPAAARPYRAGSDALAGIAVPLRLSTNRGVLSFISTTTVFGTALDIVLTELTIETFFPADSESAAIMLDLDQPGGTLFTK